MDADGFTINVSNAFAFSYLQISLCLKGGEYAVGAYQAANGTGNQTLSGLGFTPEGVLQASVGANNMGDTSGTGDGEFVIGAGDGAAQYVSHVQEINGTDPSNSANRTTSGQLAEIDAAPSQSIDGIGSLAAFNGDGFVVNWSDAAYPALFTYFAFNGGVAPATGRPMLTRSSLLHSPLVPGEASPMTLHLGNVPAGTTIYVPFTTYDKANGALVTMTGLAVTDIEIYKNGSTTQRTAGCRVCTAGYRWHRL